MNKTYDKEIGPQKAKQLLETIDERQRKIDPRRVQTYAEDMVNGRWVNTGEPITLFKGKLINGQHRLRAVVLANKPIMLTIRETETDCFPFVDRARGRTLGGALGHEIEYKGNIERPFLHSVTVTAAIVIITRYRKVADEELLSQSSTKTFDGAEKVADGEVIEFAIQNRQLLEESASLGVRLYNIQRMIPKPLIAAANFICVEAGYDDFAEFVDSVVTGEGLIGGSAALLLHNRLLKSMTEVAEKLTRGGKFYFLMRAFEMHINGETGRKLVAKQGFPLIVRRPTPTVNAV